MYSNHVWWTGAWSSPLSIVRFAFPFALLDFVLKGFALWKSAQRGQKWWFFFLLIVNSLGILPAVYLLTHQSHTPFASSTTPKSRKRK
jgi:hypothetical protein